MAEAQEVTRETMHDFIARVAEVMTKTSGTTISKKEAEISVRSVISALTDVVAEHKSILFSNAFNLIPTYYSERLGTNPQQPGTKVQIPAQWKVKFKTSKELKSRMN